MKWHMGKSWRCMGMTTLICHNFTDIQLIVKDRDVNIGMIFLIKVIYMKRRGEEKQQQL